MTFGNAFSNESVADPDDSGVGTTRRRDHQRHRCPVPTRMRQGRLQMMLDAKPAAVGFVLNENRWNLGMVTSDPDGLPWGSRDRDS
jgi:hypothetical protein